MSLLIGQGTPRLADARRADKLLPPRSLREYPRAPLYMVNVRRLYSPQPQRPVDPATFIDPVTPGTHGRSINGLPGRRRFMTIDTRGAFNGAAYRQEDRLGGMHMIFPKNRKQRIVGRLWRTGGQLPFATTPIIFRPPPIDLGLLDPIEGPGMPMPEQPRMASLARPNRLLQRMRRRRR